MTMQEEANRISIAEIAKKYKGTSIVEYLKMTGRKSDSTYRRELYQRYFPGEYYRGTADQNIKLLNAIRLDDMNQYGQFITGVKIPEITGSTIEKLTKIKKWADQYTQTDEFKKMSDDQKKRVNDIIIDKMTEILYLYFTDKNNYNALLKSSIKEKEKILKILDQYKKEKGLAGIPFWIAILLAIGFITAGGIYIYNEVYSMYVNTIQELESYKKEIEILNKRIDIEQEQKPKKRICSIEY